MFSYVAASISRFVSLKVGAIDTLGRLGFLATFWRWALIAVVWMETVIHVALEATSAMKPRAGANEAVSIKPFRAVVASGSTAIRSDVVVTVGAVRGYADLDVVLSLRFGGGNGEADSGNSN